MKNEKGITLIELLAAISILVIISTLIYGVLIGVNKNYNQLSSKTNLNQEANIILATLKNYHIKDQYHEDNGTYRISVNAKKASIGKSTADIPLHNKNFEIEIKIDDIAVSGDKTILSSHPLNIHLKLIDPKHKGQFYEIETIIKGY